MLYSDVVKTFELAIPVSTELHAFGVSEVRVFIKEHRDVFSLFLFFFSCSPYLVTCVAYPFLQWSYGFYLIHIQGQNGLEVYCKTKDLKKKWLEQFQMAL